eukprot:2181213-Amphidinium_carterae.1
MHCSDSGGACFKLTQKDPVPSEMLRHFPCPPQGSCAAAHISEGCNNAATKAPAAMEQHRPSSTHCVLYATF